MNSLKNRKFMSLLLIGIFSMSVLTFMNVVVIPSSVSDENKDADLQSADSIPLLADYDSIVDPRGETVKQYKQLQLGRDTKLDVIQPIDWSLDIIGVNVLKVQVPIDVDLTFGVTFPMNANISYNPYQVRAGQSFPYSIELDNENCTPYMTVGVVVDAELSKLNFQVAKIPSLDWSVIFEDIYYSNSWTVPFYGIETKMGNWLSYDIVDKYYALSDLIRINTEQYGVSGGVGINLNYKLYSYVTAKMNVTAPGSSSTSDIRWDDIGRKDVDINVAPGAVHGETFNVTVGDFVYHIAHEVKLTVWADLYLEIIGIKLLDERFDWGYTLPLGKIDFPEKSQYQFVSQPQVLAGKSVKNAQASYPIVNFDWIPGSGAQLTPFGRTISIPGNEKLQEWLTNMGITAGVSASVNLTFPFNEVSYYNERKVTPGNQFDYHLLMDSIDSDNPAISYNLGAFIDMKNVKIFGKNLSRYDLNTGGDLFSLAGETDLTTPFGTDEFSYEITELVQLDKASKSLNDWISSYTYGINPDIQFRAWAVLELEGYMTADVRIKAGDEGKARIVAATPLSWTQQYSTQTSRIEVFSNVTEGEQFGIEYYNMNYHLRVKPGVKLGVSMLGGIIGFDYTIFVDDATFDLDIFDAGTFTETITVQRLGTSISNFTASDDVTQGNPIIAQFTVHNTGTTSDRYIIDVDGLPVGTVASPNSPYKIGDWTPTILPSQSAVIQLELDPGLGAYVAEGFVRNQMGVRVTSISNPNIYAVSSNTEFINFVGKTNNTSDPSCLISSKITQANGLVNGKAAILKGQTLKYEITVTNLANSIQTYVIDSSSVTSMLIGVSFSGSRSLSPNTLSDIGSGQSKQSELTIVAGATVQPGPYKIQVYWGSVVEEIQFYVVESMSNIGQFTANPNLENYKYELDLYNKAAVTSGVDIIIPIKIKNVGLRDDTYTIQLQSIQPIGGSTQYVSLSSSSVAVGVNSEGSVNAIVSVPKSHLSLAGNYTFNVQVNSQGGADTQLSTVQLNLAEFTQVAMNIYDNKATRLIYTGETASYYFNLQNKGNVETTFELKIETPDGLVGRVDRTPDAKNITLAAGANQMVNITAQHVSGIPGSFKFNISANVNGEPIFATSYELVVEGVGVSITSVGNKYTLKDDNLSYNINVINKGTNNEHFNISVVGLPEGSYEIEENNIFVPAGAVGNFRINILKSAVPNIEAGPKGFTIVISTNAYSTDRTTTAVLISEYYSALPMPTTKSETSEYVDFIYKITNTGNTADTYEVVIMGLNLPYEIMSEAVLTSASVSGNKVSVAKRETVQITVRIYKQGSGGIYKPTIEIKNSQGQVVVSEKVDIRFGTYITPEAIIAIIVGVSLLAVASLGIYHMQRTGKLDEIRSKLSQRKVRREISRNELESLTERKVKKTKVELSPVDYLKDKAVSKGTYILSADAEKLVDTFKLAKGRNPKPMELDELLEGFLAKGKSTGDSGWD